MLKNLFTSKHRVLGLRKLDWLILAGGLLAYVIITLWTITKSSIWFDEAFGAYMIHFNFIDIARYTATDVHPPLFYWLLKLWSMCFGNSELALRSMSVFFGGVAITFGYSLVNKLFNKFTARISLIFMVLAPMFVRYGQEARMYTLVAAIALAATYVLIIAIDTKKKLPWVIYGILVGLGMLTHYFAAIIWIAHWIWRADVVRRTAKKGEYLRKFFSMEWIIAHIVAIGLFSVWLPFFVLQLFIVQAFGFWIPPVTPGTPINFLTNVVLYRDMGEVTGWLALAFLALLMVLAAVAIRVYQRMSQNERQSYRLILIIAFVPIFILILLSMPPVRPAFIDRYLITSTLGISIFIGVTLAFGYKYMNKLWRVLITGFVALMMIVGITNVYQLGNYNKNSHDSSQTREIVQAAVSRSPNSQPVIAATPWLFYEAVFYTTNDHPVYFIDDAANPVQYKYGSLDMLKYSDAHKIKDVKAFAKQNPVVWYVGWIGGGQLNSPESNWKQLQSVTINDPVSGKPEYEAIQFKISS